MTTYKFKCQYCGQEFESSRSDARTCSDSCRNMISRVNKQKQPTEQDEVVKLKNRIRELLQENEVLQKSLARLKNEIEYGILLKVSHQQKSKLVAAKNKVPSCDNYSLEQYILATAQYFPDVLDRVDESIDGLRNEFEKKTIL